MKVIKFFQIFANTDRTEGKGSNYALPIGFLDKDSAIAYTQTKEYAENYGVQSGPGSAYDVKEVTTYVWDSFDEWSLNGVSPEYMKMREKISNSIQSAVNSLSEEEFNKLRESLRDELL